MSLGGHNNSAPMLVTFPGQGPGPPLTLPALCGQRIQAPAWVAFWDLLPSRSSFADAPHAPMGADPGQFSLPRLVAGPSHCCACVLHAPLCLAGRQLSPLSTHPGPWPLALFHSPQPSAQRWFLSSFFAVPPFLVTNSRTSVRLPVAVDTDSLAPRAIDPLPFHSVHW